MIDRASPLSGLLARAGVSQADLARKLGVSRELVSRFCRGERPITPEYRSRIAEALGTTADALSAELHAEARRPDRELVLILEGSRLEPAGPRDIKLLEQLGAKGPITPTGPAWLRLLDRARDEGIGLSIWV